MAYGQAGTILRHLCTILDTQAARSLTDGQLLERFIARRDESAFGVLMQRHGRLVWSVCRNILHPEQDAEDAFQATFLVLARRAESIRKGESVGSWLYGVAHRVAMKAKKAAAKRWRYERDAMTKKREATSSELALRELQAVLHEELERLPEKYRTPFVLCCLEGRSRKEVADELGWKEGTVSSRIAQARIQLQRRLTRRGVALSAVLCATAVVPNAAAAALVAKTIREVMLDTVGQAKVISAQVAALADGVVKAMAFSKLKIGVAIVLGVGLVASGVGFSANQALQPKSQATGGPKPPAVAAAALLSAEDRPSGKPALREDRPFLALWRQHDGRRGGSEAPYLRFAVWSDGGVLYAKDPDKWGHELRRGKISAARLKRLKAALADSGVFDLKGTCYLVPDAPCDCLMVDQGNKKQMLYWDEIETAGYGINIDPKPHHLEFKRCWKAVNHLGLVALPDEGEAVKERVQVPKSWYLKQAVQSE